MTESGASDGNEKSTLPSRFDDCFSKQPPEHLYHYTDQTGLLGILEKGELWATKIQYMNDTTEFAGAVILATKLLKERFEKETMRAQIIIQTILQRINNITNVNLCAVSFCENPDVLSQWRGYAGSVGGVSIGFQSDILARVGSRARGRLGPCVYNEEAQKEIIAEIIDDILGGAGTESELTDQDFLRLAASFDEKLISVGAFFKASGFVEESEWRLVTGIVGYSDTEFRFRAGKSMLTPYYVLKIKSGEWGREISSVTIGPCPHRDISAHAVHGLFYKHGIADGSAERDESGRLSFPLIKSSNIPFRNW
jgi:hypothetical protein